MNKTEKPEAGFASSFVLHPSPFLQLVRLPNVFTAMADILLGFLLTHRRLDPWQQFAILLSASSVLYLAGIVLNDYFDREQDARERPFRPIPSGRVSAQTALRVGVAMLVAGAALGWVAAAVSGNIRPGVVATLLAGAVLLYDGLLKQTPLGPVAMGSCRTLNVLLGMSVSLDPWTAPYWVVAIGVGLYIAGVTIYARSEARESGRVQLTLGVVVMLLGIATVASTPAWATGGEWPAFNVHANWYVFWALFGGLIAYRALRAVFEPRPELVQAAVRNCIFSLIVMDAAACLAVQDIFWGVVILTLLVPTLFLGRWIYST
jgi:4-hydroxybenzoate polyprenyltransferase